MHSDPDGPVVLTVVRDEVEAAAIVTALDANGMQASATGGYTAGFRAEAPGEIRVMVRRGDLDNAQRVLDEIRANQAPIDWSQVDVGEPDED